MAFPEGSPTHPSYTAGHATVAGACITILKAMFDTENFVIPNPVVPTADGSALCRTTARRSPSKASSTSSPPTSRPAATSPACTGARTAYASLRLGQEIAISILRDQKKILNEGAAAFNFRGFDGERIVVRDGGVFNTI